MPATTQINMINLQVFAEDQARLDQQNGTYDANLAGNNKYYIWQSSFQTLPMGMENQPEAYAQQLRANLPDVNTLRLPFNAYSFNADGSLHPDYERFIVEAAKQGFQFVFGYFDGDTQEFGGSAQPASADQMRAQLNGAIHDRMMDSWGKMLDWLDAHPGAAAAVYALEAVNEPNTYARAEERTGDSGEFVRLYGEHMAEFAELVQERSDARVMIGGFAYSAQFNVLGSTPSGTGQGSVLDQIRQAAGDGLVWSAHLYPDWASGAGQEFEGFAALIRQNYGVLGGDDIIITETNATGGDSNNAAGNDPSLWMARAYEAFLDAGIGLGWFLGAEASQSAFLSIDNGTQIRFRHPDSFAHGMNAFTMGEDDPNHAGNEAITARLLSGFVTDEDRGPTGLAGLGYAAGYGGNDTLSGIDNAMNMLFGGDGNDVLTGRAVRDHLFGQHGNDTLSGLGGNDVLSGGDGDDLVQGGTGSDLLTGGRGADSFVFADGGQDVVTDYRREQGDSLTLGGQLWTDAQLAAAGQTIDSDGDGAVDDLALVWAQGRVVLMNYGIVRRDGIVHGSAEGDRVEVGWSDAHGDLLSLSGSQIDGGDGDDTVIGSMSADTILGGAGADVLSGRGGSGRIEGGSGNDTITGDTGNDTLDGGTGDDSIHGGADQDVIYGGLGNDLLDGGEGNDSIIGGAGLDILIGAGGDDTLMGGDDADLISDARGRNLLCGEQGNDTISGGADQDTIDGGLGRDSLSGNGGDDLICGGADNDSLSGGQGHDRLMGDDGLDTLIGGAGNDTYFVDAIGDVVREGWDGGTDTVEASISYALSSNVENLVLTGTAVINGTGNAQANAIFGNAGTNNLSGREGNDTLRGFGGDDRLGGGSGDDRLFGNDGNDLLNGDDGNDMLLGNGGSDTLLGSNGNDVHYGGDGDDLVEGGIGADFLAGEVGNDAIRGNLGIDRLRGDAGNDWLDGGEDSDTLQGGDGNDMVLGGSGDDIAYAGQGDDSLGGGSGNDFLAGDAGHDVIRGGAGADRMMGGDGNDVVSGDAGNDTMRGGTSNDRLAGSDGNDVIYSDAGDDHLSGGAGDDILTGGVGADVFVFDGGRDRITDFQDNIDRVEISAHLAGSGATVRSLLDGAFMNGTVAILDFGASGRLAIAGVTDLSQLNDDLILI